MKKLNHQFRQGDVLIERVAKLSPAKPAKGSVLAHGEATGHHHSIEDPTCAVLMESATGLEIDIRKSTRIVHQEHAPIPLKRSRTRPFARVTRQREYSPEAIRNVAD